MSGLLRRMPWISDPAWWPERPGLYMLAGVQLLRKFWREFWFPPICPGCDRTLPSDASGACESCWRQLVALQPVEAQRCSVCHNLSGTDRSNLCRYCGSRRVFFDWHWSARPMQGIWREALHRWKFENDRRLWRLFWSLCITPELLERCRTLKIDRVVWIDSGAAGRQVRNYQPCADVALALTRALAAPGGCGPDLRKKRAGQRSAQSYAERFFSVHNSLEFCGAGEARTYLLVEDVFTTGATANEASRVLKKNGAFHVFVISLLLRDGEAC